MILGVGNDAVQRFHMVINLLLSYLQLVQELAGMLFLEVEQAQVHGHTSIFELLSLENIKAIYSRSSLVFLALPYLSI